MTPENAAVHRFSPKSRRLFCNSKKNYYHGGMNGDLFVNLMQKIK